MTGRGRGPRFWCELLVDGPAMDWVTAAAGRDPTRHRQQYAVISTTCNEKQSCCDSPMLTSGGKAVEQAFTVVSGLCT